MKSTLLDKTHAIWFLYYLYSRLALHFHFINIRVCNTA